MAANIENLMDEIDELKRAVRLWRGAAETAETELAALRALLAEAENVVLLYLSLCRLMEIEAPEAQALLPRIRAALEGK